MKQNYCVNPYTEMYDCLSGLCQASNIYELSGESVKETARI